jgi:hypothetical protein
MKISGLGANSPSPQPSPTRGEGVKEHRLEACATKGKEMGKDKFKKRKERKRLIRAELLRRNIRVKDVAAGLGVSMVAVYKGMMTGSARVAAALIEAGVPARMFKSRGQGSGARGQDSTSPEPKSPLTPLCKGGEGKGERG